MSITKKTAKLKKQPKDAKKLKKKAVSKKAVSKKVHPVKSPAKSGGARPKGEQFNGVKKLVKKPARYLGAIGRRKTAVARVQLWTRGENEFLINNKPYQEYFPTQELQQTASASLRKMKCLDRFRVLVKVRGGGVQGQAEAVRHGTARILILFNPDFQKRLRKAGYLTRDSRMRERKKFGLKRARRAPQWAKR